MKQGPTLRAAKSSEADILTELAIRSKAHWGYSAEFMAACRAELTVTAAKINDPECDYFVCEAVHSIVGFFAIGPALECDRELDALFVEPQCMGLGYGGSLLEYAKEVARARGAKALLIQSDPNAAAFYAAAGAIHIRDTESASIAGRFLPEFKIELPTKSA